MLKLDSMAHLDVNSKGYNGFVNTEIKEIENILQKESIELSDKQKSALTPLTRNGLKLYIDNILKDRKKPDSPLVDVIS